ncbi:hypothetical protein [Rugamonas apoptosis]|uniref:Uncharacterized protein n=1 Tax=Rugamonas apoptosis TaxID=2758570 RepID=A0A7W2IMY6_9BURK|nr:hypothetical protein [Rugamonas apoptosis]MBA5690061.1 hypothetical protein [Rugamonas apoptosis]
MAALPTMSARLIRCCMLSLGAGMWVVSAPAAQTDKPARHDAAVSADAATLSLEQYARLPVCTLSADGQHLAVQPCRTAPTRQPKARRAVTAIIPAMPPRPVPRVSVAPPLPPLSPPPPLHQTPRPTPITTCDAGGCYDAAGVRHTGAGGNTTISPSGQLCLRDGVWLQCQ